VSLSHTCLYSTPMAHASPLPRRANSLTDGTEGVDAEAFRRHIENGCCSSDWGLVSILPCLEWQD